MRTLYLDIAKVGHINLDVRHVFWTLNRGKKEHQIKVPSQDALLKWIEDNAPEIIDADDTINSLYSWQITDETKIATFLLRWT